MTVLCMDYFGAQGADPPDPVGAGHAPGPPWAWSLPVLHHRLRQGVQSKEAHKQPRGPPGHRISALVVIAVDLLKEWDFHADLQSGPSHPVRPRGTLALTMLAQNLTHTDDDLG